MWGSWAGRGGKRGTGMSRRNFRRAQRRGRIRSRGAQALRNYFNR